MTSERLSGELFDLTITSLNNPYGYEKIFYSLLHGITMPIQKYIDELEMIGNITQDDKSEKRSVRLQFLKATREDSEINSLSDQITFSMLSNDEKFQRKLQLSDHITSNFFDNYFKDIMCYLNGGNPFDTSDLDRSKNRRRLDTNIFKEKKNYFPDNKLIITIAGGNIITIFAKLFVNLATYLIQIKNGHTTLTAPESLSWFNLKYYETYIYSKNEPYTFDILKYIFYKFFPNYLEESDWKELLLSKYSDFDYNLLPNKHSDEKSREEIKRILNESISSINNESQGFILMRIKSNLLYNNPEPNNIFYNSSHKKTLITNCFKLKISNNAALQKIPFIPQMLSNTLVDNYLNQFSPSNQVDFNKTSGESDNKNKCKEALNYLLLKKQSISNETSVNVKTIIKVFRNGYTIGSSAKLLPITNNAGTSLFSTALDPDILDLDAIMKYLHTVTNILNTQIYHYEQGESGLSQAITKHTFIPYSGNQNISNFASLCSITNYNNQLLMLSGYLLKVFLNYPDFHTEQVLDELITDTITDEYRYTSGKYFSDTWEVASGRPNLSLLQSKVVLVPGNITNNNCSRREIQTHLNDTANYLRMELKSDYPPPDGSILTINRIETDNVFDTSTLAPACPVASAQPDSASKPPDNPTDYSIDTLDEAFKNLNITNAKILPIKDTTLDEDELTNIEAELGGIDDNKDKIGSSKYSSKKPESNKSIKGGNNNGFVKKIKKKRKKTIKKYSTSKYKKKSKKKYIKKKFKKINKTRRYKNKTLRFHNI